MQERKATSRPAGPKAAPKSTNPFAQAKQPQQVSAAPSVADSLPAPPNHPLPPKKKATAVKKAATAQSALPNDFWDD
jgi:hypothetical protein